MTALAVTIHIFVALLLGTFAGWIGHWALHQRWAGRFAKAHLVHHRLYPPQDFLAPAYRDAQGSNTTLFLGPFITLVMLGWMGVLVALGAEWYVFVCVLLVGIEVGILHEYVHEAMHLEHHPLERFMTFRRLRTLHLKHHQFVQSNLGIVWYGWDRLFRTLKK